MSDHADIAVQAHGPYVVRGLPLQRRRIIESEHGEPITTETTERLETREVYALCRCGHSADKPFCDGTHAKIAFDGTETAATNSYDERATTYRADHLVVQDDRSVCVHAGFCGNRVTNVWDAMSDDTTDDSIVRAQVINMVERCPSGALTYRFEADGADVEPDLRAAVGVLADGPLHVTGGVTIHRSDGVALEGRNRVTLCRCGESKNKPLCDGTHREAGFTG